MDFVLFAIMIFAETNKTSEELKVLQIEQVQIEFRSHEACELGKQTLLLSFDTSEKPNKIVSIVKAECLYRDKSE